MTDIRKPREHTKLDRLLSLLQTGEGASLEDMTEATGWQSHTVRASLTGLKKRGYTIERKLQGTTAVWAIAGTAETATSSGPVPRISAKTGPAK